jgi:hypothetical protein
MLTGPVPRRKLSSTFQAAQRAGQYLLYNQAEATRAVFPVIGSGGRSAFLVPDFLKAHSDLAENWRVRLGVGCSHDDTIRALVVNCAAQANENELEQLSSKIALQASDVKAILEPDMSPTNAALAELLVE